MERSDTGRGGDPKKPGCTLKRAFDHAIVSRLTAAFRRFAAPRGTGLAQCAALGLTLASSACYRQEAPTWPGYNLLAAPLPTAPRVVGGVPVSEADYRRILSWGADWFRYETFGGERMITDVVGLLNSPVEVPCSGEAAGAGCTRTESDRKSVV